MPATPEDLMESATSRRLPFPREAVWAAFADPTRLAAWWGPAGFENAFHAFDLRPGGEWRFTMTGPDGATFEQTKRFVEVTPPARVAFDHVQAGHGFRMTIETAAEDGGTRVAWRMAFEEPQAPETMAFIARANEENLDRLAAHLAALPAG